MNFQKISNTYPTIVYNMNQVNAYCVLGTSITCDNASLNDTMTSELPKLLEKFPGPLNQTQCFNHVLAIVAV
jgi:hypothetical protein